MQIIFPGGKVVSAVYNGHIIDTDQPAAGGGQGSAPGPFDLFIASIGTCAGIYVLNFCEARNLATEGLRLMVRPERNTQSGMVEKITIEIQLPRDFPEKYMEAVKRAAEHCAVKKHLQNPPEFEVYSTISPAIAVAA